MSHQPAMVAESLSKHKPVSGLAFTVQQGLEQLVFGSGLVFNFVWEDPAIDRAALALTEESVLFTIASAGDNALTLALDNPQKIYAVDLNPAQVYLVQLKIAAIQRLAHEDFWHLFSLAPAPRAPQLYQSHLRPHLPSDAQRFWDTRLHLLQKGLSRAGVFGRTLWALRTYLKVVCGARTLERLFENRSLAEQADYYLKRIHARWWNPLARPWADQLPILLLFGAHPHQARRVQSQRFGQVLADGIARALTTLPVQDNFFWQQVFLERYLIPPDYARPENFARLKANASRIEVHNARAQQLLQALPTGRVTHFNLLDAPDWLSPAETIELWALIRRAATPGAKVLFRTIDPTYQLPPEILTAWRDETDPAWTLNERTGVYAKVCLYELA